jgi:hypothetical protein
MSVLALVTTVGLIAAYVVISVRTLKKSGELSQIPRRIEGWLDKWGPAIVRSARPEF